jgi:hypothetical protein
VLVGPPGAQGRKNKPAFSKNFQLQTVTVPNGSVVNYCIAQWDSTITMAAEKDAWLSENEEEEEFTDEGDLSDDEVNCFIVKNKKIYSL